MLRAAEQRQWWVYLTPEQAAALYANASFDFIKNAADQNHLAGMVAKPAHMQTGHAWTEELRRSLDLLTATYAGLKYGRFGGNAKASELQPYYERIRANWLAAVYHGPVHLWTDGFTTPANISGDRGWHQGDLDLRHWMVGALPAYDAIRDDLDQQTRETIDAWLSGLIDKLWKPNAFDIQHNRGVCRMAKAHLMALLIQDRTRVEALMNHSTQGFYGLLQHYQFAPKSGSNLEHRPGFSREHGYKTGPYGRNALEHPFATQWALEQAARTGGNPEWSLARASDRALRDAILDSWYVWGTSRRSDYIAYCNMLEDRWGGVARTTDGGLQAKFWVTLACLDTRFLAVDYWRNDDPEHRLWAIRARLTAELGASGSFNQQPQVNFTASSTSGTAPLTVTLDASASTDPDGHVVSYAWTFGNGASASGITASYTYTTPGIYTTTLTVTDDKGAKASKSVSVVVDVNLNGLTKLAIASVVASAAEAGNSPAQSIDGDLNTRWSAQGNPQTVTYTLAQPATLELLRIAFYLGNQRTTNFDIQVSSNGQNWMTIGSGPSSGQTNALETFDLGSHANVGWVRYVGQGNTVNDWNSLLEVELWGTVADSSPAVTYAVTYNANGATSGTAPSAQTKAHDTALTLATNSGNLARTGFHFAGWNTAANGSGTNYATAAHYAVNAGVTLYAKWTAVTYAVTYHANGATSGTVPAAQSKTHGVALTLATNSGNLTQTGFTFTGWNTAAHASGTSYPVGASYSANTELMLYAQWSAESAGPGSPAPAPAPDSSVDAPQASSCGVGTAFGLVLLIAGLCFRSPSVRPRSSP